MSSYISKQITKVGSYLDKQSLIRVLQVDDELDLLKTSKQILELQGPFQIESTNSVKEAFEKIKEKEFDVIISDYQMPEKNGLEFLEKLRTSGDQTSFILFTGKGREEVAVKALNLGADSYINKMGQPSTVYSELSHSILQISKKNSIEKRLIYKANLESVISQISSRFVNPANLNKVINDSIADIGEISKASRVYIFLFQQDGKLMDNTHEWCKSEISPQIGNLKNVPTEIFSWWMEQLQNEKIIQIQDVSLMPPEAKKEREFLEKQSIQSVVVLPINVFDKLVGFIGFDNCENTRCWKNDDVILLQIVAELIGTTFERKQTERKYRGLFENTGTAMCVLESDKTISLVNKKFEELSGYSKNEIIGQKWTSFVSKDCQKKMQKYHDNRRKLDGKSPNTYSFNYIDKQGQVKTGILNIELLPETNQSVASIIDISETKKIEGQLKEKNQQFRQLFESMPSGVAVYEAINNGEDFVFKDFNEAASRIEKMSRKDVIGKRVTEVFPSIKDFGLFEVFQRVYRTGLLEHFPTKFYSDSRECGWRENWVYRLLNKTVVSIFNDTTEQKKSEEILKENEKKYRTLFERMVQGVFYQKSDGSLFDVNQAALDMFGLSRDEFTNRDSKNPGWKVITEDGRELHDEEYPSMVALKTGKEMTDVVVGVFNPKEQDYRWLNVNAIPQFNDGESDPFQVFVTLHDVTERRKAEEHSTVLKDKFKRLFDTTMDGVLFVDSGGKIELANQAAATILGYQNPQEIMNILVVTHYVDPEDRKVLFERLLKGGSINNYELKLKKKDDTPVYVKAAIDIHKDPSGNILASEAIFTDITEHKKITKQLRESENKYRTIIDTMTDAVEVIGFDGKNIDVNKAAVEALGYSREELLKMGPKDFDNNFTNNQILKMLQKVKSKGKMVFETTHTTKDGKTFPVEISAGPVTYHGKEVVLSIARDITERKIVKEMLEKIENEKKAILDSMSELVILQDLKHRTLWANRKAADSVNLKTEQIKGEYCYKLWAKSTKPCAGCPIEESLKTGEPQHREMITPDGKVWSIKGYPIKNSNGSLTSIVEIIKDITEQKKIEKELQESEKKYRQLLNGMNDTAWVIDFEGNIIEVNDAAVEALGYSREEFRSIGLTGIDSNLEPEKIKALAESMSVNKMQVFETVHTSKGGKKIPVEISSSLVTYKGKQAILSIARDITKRKRTEEQLKQSEKKYRRQFEEMLDGIVLAEVETGIIVDCNREITELVGRTKSELIGKHQRILHPPTENNEEFSGTFKQHIKEKEGQVLETQIITKTGEIKDVEVKANIIFEVNGKRILQGLFHDITDQKQKEGALIEAVKELELNDMENQILVDTAKTILQFPNFKDASRSIFNAAKGVIGASMGYIALLDENNTKNEVLFLDSSNLKCAVNPNLPMPIRGLREKAYSACKPMYENNFTNSSFKHLLPDGHVHLQNVLFAPLVINEVTVGLIGLANKPGGFTEKDTQKVLAFAELGAIALKHNQTWEQLRKSKAQTEVMNEKLNVVGKLTRHDVRNKLSIIKNNIYLAKLNLTGDNSYEQYLNSIDSAVDKIGKIYDFASTYEKLGAEELSYVNVGECVDEAWKLFSGLDEKVKLVNNCHDLVVLADSLLQQLLYNLIDDSLKHGEKVTQIKVYFKESKEYRELIYEDDGIGIPENEKDLIFKEGYGKGTGYGLYLIKKMCETYGWAIKETGKQGKGAQFTLIIPKK